MTIMLYLHIGYLVHMDARGIEFGLGQNPNWSPGQYRYRWNGFWVFPWWWSLRAIRTHLWVWRMNRRQARYYRKHPEEER